MRDAPGGRLAKWGTGTATAQNDVVNNRYAGLRASSSVVLHTRASSTAGDAIVATWRFDSSAAFTAGAYQTTTTFTLVANP